MARCKATFKGLKKGNMAGVEERVRGFIESWPKVKGQLEEVLKEDERLLHGDGACYHVSCKCQDDLQAAMGEGDPGL